MTNVLKRMAVQTMVCGTLWMGSAAQAQVGQADIVNISTTPGLEGTTEYSAGAKIEIKIGMFGEFGMTNTNPGPFSLPQLRVTVNGENSSFAQMEDFAPSYYPASFRTYFTFWYTVKPGDMASPLKIYGLAGSGTGGDAYDVVNNGYVFYNKSTSSNLVWRFNWMLGGAGDSYDLDFSMVAKRSIKTLSFDDLHSPVTVTATENAMWRVTTQNPIEGGGVSFYVWPANTNLVRVGSVPGQGALLVSMPAGTAAVDFPITGLSVGTTDIYLQRVNDYQNNTALGVNNYIKRTLTVTAPPEPTVRVRFSGSDTVTLNESRSVNTGSLTVELTQAFAQDVWVRLNTTPPGQGNVSFTSNPCVARVPAGSLISSEIPFSLPDGTGFSEHDGIVISPTVTNAAAAAVFTCSQSGMVYVQNVKPQILQPQVTDTPTVCRDQPYSFEWAVTDVPSDMAAGMTLTWNFGDGTPNVTVSNATGSVVHTFTTPKTGSGTKTVKVIAKDKEGTVSDEVRFTVTVEQPLPKPSVRVVPSAYEYIETSTNSTGRLDLFLSETFGDDVWVQLTTSPAGQSNIVLSTTNAIRIPSGSTNSLVGVKFSIPDGSLLSEVAGIDINLTVTNLVPKLYFTDLQGATVYVNNVRPKITKPLARDLALTPLVPYDNVPLATPFAFDWTVADVPADGPTMAVIWDFGDGNRQTVTGLTGVVSHTYVSMGHKVVTVQAADKDGGVSDEIQFKVTVTPPPPPPTVTILPPAGPMSETSTPSTGQITVHLSEAFTNAVTVQLNVTPANSAVNGSLLLSTNKVVIGKGQSDVVVKFSAKDGADLSRDAGFIVTPVVLETPAAVAYYTELVPGLISVLNVAPRITMPLASDISGDPGYVLQQGTPWIFPWIVSDVSLDLPAMSVTWYFGDGATQTVTGGSGTVSHTYMSAGDWVVCVVAIDKDGGSSQVIFKIRVAARQTGFVLWAARKGISGDPDILLGLDHNGDGIANGFEYAFGTNLTEGVPLLNIRMVDGRPQVETPKRDPDSTVDVHVTVEGCTNLFSGDWSLPMGPSAQSGKPDNRDWYAPLVTVPDKAFFRLRAVRE